MTARLITGSTSDGYIPRQLADFQIAINESLALIVDPSTGEYPFQNATDDTLMQQFVAILAEAMMASDNAAGWLSQMRNPLTARGALLSAIVQLNGIIRKPGAPTYVQMTLTGTPSTVIPVGSLIGEASGSRVYATNADVVIPASGEATVAARCTTDGPYIPAVGSVVVIQTPIPGWDNATNTTLLSAGTNEETDAELVRRQQLSTNATSYRQIEAIQAAVLNIEGVTFCRAYQNRTLSTDDRGIPGKTLACVAVGGDDYDIADAILLRSPLGIGFYGNTAMIVIDRNGEGVTVQFSRPVERPIWIRVTLSVVNDERIQMFPSNGIQLVKEAIVNFAETGHSTCEPLGNTGFPPGQDIIRSYLYTPINSIGGSIIRSIALSEDGVNYSEADIAIAWDEIGIITEDRIEVIFV